MSNYGQELEETIKMYNDALPQDLKETVNPKVNTLEKETARSQYLMDILENAISVVDGTADKLTQKALALRMADTLKHYTEGGGAGSEALSRLVGLGVIDEMPAINVSYSTRIADVDELEVQVDPKESTIDLLVRFNAHVPDEEGNETWRDNNRDGNLCTSRIKLNLSDRENIAAFLDKTQKDYDELLKIKHSRR